MIHKSLLLATFLAASPKGAESHGHMTYPPNRVNGSIQNAGNCNNGACFVFSQPMQIPGKPTLNEAKYRTYNINVKKGKKDWSAHNPWRAPGSAPVYGSGCGAAGGGPKADMASGGSVQEGLHATQGEDGLLFPAVPEKDRAVWRRGSVQEVASAMLANHGGGWSWRLCPTANASEACFQSNVLAFASDQQTLRYADFHSDLMRDKWYNRTFKLKDVVIPMTKWVDPKTGAEWAKNPVPSCLLCDQGECMKRDVKREGFLRNSDSNSNRPGKKGPAMGSEQWIEEMTCSQSCSGLGLKQCSPGMAQFPPPANGISGFDQIGSSGLTGFQFSIVEKVKVPKEVAPGAYLLSWRWDCEQSAQVWQNCADIEVV